MVVKLRATFVVDYTLAEGIFESTENEKTLLEQLVDDQGFGSLSVLQGDHLAWSLTVQESPLEIDPVEGQERLF